MTRENGQTTVDSMETVNPSEPTGFRLAESADIAAVVATVTSAFLSDPLWGPVFDDHDAPEVPASQLWNLFVSSAALRYPWTYVTPGSEAAAVWYPPGASEFTEAEVAGYDAFLERIVGRARADEILAIGEICDAAHPTEPSFYLSLLATHSEHRGSGLGMGLLAQTLRLIDAEGMPAYLESSNPANDARYARFGFEPHGTLTAPSGHRFTTMWRPAQSR